MKITQRSLSLTPCFFLLAALLPMEAFGQSESPTIGQVLKRLATEPTISQVQQAALRQAALEPERIHSALTRLRWAPLLPRVEVSVDRGFGRDEDIDREYEQMDELSLGTDEDLGLRCTVRWDLDRLIFDPEELRAQRQATDHARRSRELLLAVTRMYFELLFLRAEQEMGAASSEPQQQQMERVIRIAELRAVLDGLTGGLFSTG